MIYEVAIREDIYSGSRDIDPEYKSMVFEKDTDNKTNDILSFRMNNGGIRPHYQVSIKKLYNALLVIDKSTEIAVDVDRNVTVRRCVNRFNESVVLLDYDRYSVIMSFPAFYAVIESVAKYDI